ncbi:glycosyltransferase [Emticicia sp. 21SJ11W-3]|uniref:glycosyltransferase family 2 protein n=1 Tax=Emticicia sp. 21SJ11W-3 TaxID=2916755 RepID=UPI00209CD81C|nr:glycosyltransferase [Emticicia sp. 21SJ11W-3]UTA69807.1 glycosyltransferase [Emticicia sp. 21SJ11W-3]
MEDNFTGQAEALVTVGLPVYNDSKYLKFAIQSVINQTFTRWRLIIINDGSVDNTEEIIKGFLFDKRITYLTGENEGLVARLNQLSNLCKTRYYCRMDSDDIMHPEKLQKQVDVLEAHPEIDVLGTNAYTIDASNIVLGMRNEYHEINYIRKVRSFIHPTIMGKSEWFRANPYDPDAIRLEDVELWFRTAGKSNFMIITQPLFFYREVGENYFKKYVLIGRSRFKILEKYNGNTKWQKFFIKNAFVGMVYRLFNVFNKEQWLIARRNKVNFEERKHYENYLHS